METLLRRKKKGYIPSKCYFTYLKQQILSSTLQTLPWFPPSVFSPGLHEASPDHPLKREIPPTMPVCQHSYFSGLLYFSRSHLSLSKISLIYKSLFYTLELLINSTTPGVLLLLYYCLFQSLVSST